MVVKDYLFNGYLLKGRDAGRGGGDTHQTDTFASYLNIAIER